ncbi:protein of unknown function [Acidithiobacillus ferrivorans]|uniref:Reverse transcriptase domain-containing protein n=1 Tax=Acidithiobacillus ferrivorans TaxID=160808 RepID=A0ABY1MRN2_9PROT|nr:protein of unknown function [Acidithiobacillus ferrivorans]
MDGERFEDVEAYGVERWIGELAETLRKKMYQPQAVKRVYIPKPGGKMRPLGIPTLRDRVVQTATMMVIEPIFEADLQPEQYAYRAGRNALTAVREVHSLLKTGHKQVVDTDLSSYFDTIPHAELMKSVARRIVDRHLLHLIKMWLDAPVEEGDGRGNTQRTTVNRDQGRGTPQGAPISPLLSVCTCDGLFWDGSNADTKSASGRESSVMPMISSFAVGGRRNKPWPPCRI